MTKVGRNDPCPCGSGKKYKNCCLDRPKGTAKKKFKAVLLSKPKEVNLIERTFGEAITSATPFNPKSDAGSSKEAPEVPQEPEQK